MLDEQVKELREAADNLYKHTQASLQQVLCQAADTIESFSSKSATKNMEQECFKRLAEYEKTGLDPQQIVEIDKLY